MINANDAYQKLELHYCAKKFKKNPQDLLSDSEEKEYEEIIKRHPHYACAYAVFILHKRWEEAEEYIKKDPKAAVNYAKNVIKKRWEEAEEYIKKDPKELISYAINVLKRRWTKEEHIMLNASPNQLFVYFKWLYNKSPFDWPEAEKCFEKNVTVLLNYLTLIKKTSNVFENQILNDPENKSSPRYIYEYSKLLRTRWKEAEHIIFKNAEYSVKYCARFDMELPEDVHNKVVAEVAFTNASVSKKIYINKISKTKKTVQKYIQDLINKNTITLESSIKDLMNNF